MSRKGSTGAGRICSKCGHQKNPSGYCPTCYQLKKCSFSTQPTINTITAQSQTGKTCSKCGFAKNPSGYCPMCYKIKKNNAYQPTRTSSSTSTDYALPRTYSSVTTATCSTCGCIKNPSGYCPTCYQLEKKSQLLKNRSTPVAKTARTSTNTTCSKCGYEKNPSGYCPTCYQRKKQEKEEYAVYKTSLVNDFQTVRPLQEDSSTASPLEDFLLVSTPIKKATSIMTEDESGYITSDFEDSLLSTSSSPERETASPITLTTVEQAISDTSTGPGIPNESTPTKAPTISKKLTTTYTTTASNSSTEATQKTLTEDDSLWLVPTISPSTQPKGGVPNESTPTKAPTISKKPTTAYTTTTSNLTTEATQKTLTEDDSLWLVPTIPPSTQPKGTAPVTITPLEEESSEWTYISNRVLQTMPQTNIQGIYKVYNEWLMERYKFAKRRMLCKYNNRANEKILFHGTSEVPPSKIIHSEFGFDFRHCHKGMWGIGSYFAVNASYSNSYSYKPPGKGYREIMAAWVLVGESYRCEQDNSLRKPPAKSKDNDEYYDSVCGHVAGSDMYVVYDHEKAYPSYIIRYTS